MFRAYQREWPALFPLDAASFLKGDGVLNAQSRDKSRPVSRVPQQQCALRHAQQRFGNVLSYAVDPCPAHAKGTGPRQSRLTPSPFCRETALVVLP